MRAPLSIFVIAAAAMLLAADSSALPGVPVSRVIEVYPTDQAAVEEEESPEPDPLAVLTVFQGTLTEKLAEAEKMLKQVPLKVGEQDIVYYEDRLVHDSSGWKSSQIKRKEPEKEIALALLNVRTGDIKIVKITKHGDELASPPDFPISIVERSNGIRWNQWNTQFKAPKGYIVIKNSYPDTPSEKIKKVTVDGKGRKKTTYETKVENFIYSPYSQELHVPELVDAGRTYVKSVVKQALVELRKRGVRSRAFSGKYIGDSAALHPEFYERLPVIEQTDLTEFILEPRKTSERVLVLIGANPQAAFAKTGSPAGALGWVQYTPSTYAFMRGLYPEAKLIKDFKTGAPDHLNSMMAAILLYDHHLGQLMKKQGAEVISDPRLEEYLAAAYNGGPGRINSSLTASLAAKMADWVFHIRDETKGYIVKLRTLHELDKEVR